MTPLQRVEPHEQARPGVKTVLAATLTAYFAIVTAVLDRGAATAVDQAVVTLMKVALGATVILTLGLLAGLAHLDDQDAAEEKVSE
jgi:hypothetical protein